MNTLDHRHALVTGGGSGVGAAIALELAQAGATVTIAGRRRDALDEIAERHQRIRAAVADISVEAEVASLFEQAVANVGPVDIAIANAGVSASQSFADMPLEHWNQMIAVNLTGAFLTLKHAAPAMIERGFGRMICVASTAGLKGYPYVAAYCAAKHGVIGLVRALAVEYARRGITVNAVCPGFTESPMLKESVARIVDKTNRSEEQARAALAKNNPMGRFVQPEEIAQAVAWLCGPHSDAVNGQAIGITGGEI